MAVVCAQCGQENPDGFRFCGRCGSPIAEPSPTRETRKTVTVLFADVVGSTALSESRDPETVRMQMASWFDDARTILERHGGTVEKFIGDAVMAVFGMPRVHEDDALRAVRAAAELQRPGLRIGVNTGEVVAGEGETLVTGDAVNIAARLEQAAAAGEVLIGSETRRLVRDAVQVEALQALELKGKSAPVAAFRLLGVDVEAAGVARRLDSPLVGRERERARLRADFERVVSDRSCQLFTLLGAAGVGKSRLVLDFLESADARIVRARCLPYGEGITYWPLVEVVLQLGADPDAVLGSSPAETQLAFRRLLEREAVAGPLVVVFDDLQWAEETFLDLVEHVSDWSRGAPIFVLCVARPELLDARPTWAGGKLNATSILLEPLPPGDAEQLVENLLDGAELDAPTRERILTAADGNPLFVEEMIAMVRDDGDADFAVPPTIHALLEARLDRLGTEERAVIERGAVEGEVFHQTAVIELAPEGARAGVPQQLLALVRKELIRPNTATFPDDEAFRFRHLLIRDAAYDALPKATRAELHERFARWLDAHAHLVEQDEIVGYHLEQAALYCRELGTNDPELASSAAGRLRRAQGVAHAHGDLVAALNLARRALQLLPKNDPERLDILPSLVHMEIAAAEFTAAEADLAELAGVDAPGPRAYALVFRAALAMTRGTFDDLAGERARIHEAAETFDELGDARGSAHAERMLGGTLGMECRAEAAGAASARARAYAEQAGDLALANEMTSEVFGSIVMGPTAVDDAIAAGERLIAEAADRPLMRARAKRGLARMLAIVGEFDRARSLAAESLETMRQAGLTLAANTGVQASGFVEQLAGDDEAAVEFLREGAEELRRVGDHRFFSTTALSLVQPLLELGRTDEAEQWLEEATADTNPADVTDSAAIEAARGRIAALRGDHAAAIEHVERAVEIAERTDYFDLRTTTHLDHAYVLALAGRRDDAAAAYEHALAVTRAKGATAWTKQIEVRLAEL